MQSRATVKPRIAQKLCDRGLGHPVYRVNLDCFFQKTLSLGEGNSDTWMLK